VGGMLRLSFVNCAEPVFDCPLGTDFKIAEYWSSFSFEWVEKSAYNSCPQVYSLVSI
jgi:hypothetical protein